MMRARVAAVAAAVLTAGTLAGCSSSSGAAAAPSCSTASLDTLAEIGQALTTPPGRGLYDGEQLSLRPAVDGYTSLVAARVNNGTDQPIGVWALDSAGVDAVDAVAQRYTSWGAATQSGSQAARDRQRIVASKTYAAVRNCVPSQP